jgi:hypothetical protein
MYRMKYVLATGGATRPIMGQMSFVFPSAACDAVGPARALL